MAKSIPNKRSLSEAKLKLSNPIENRRTSLEGLLHDIYEDWPSPPHCSLDTEGTGTDTSISNLSDYFNSNFPFQQSASVRRTVFSKRSLGSMTVGNNVLVTAYENVDYDIGVMPRFDKATLRAMDVHQLSQLKAKLRAEVASTSLVLVKHLKRRDHQMSRMRARCNVVTAILQALSPKRSVDAKLQFTLDPPSGENGYDQWLNAMRSVARLPDGMPHHFRKRLWLSLADHYVKTANIDWDMTSRRAFNDRMNDDDDELSMQIVKDLHRTGWSGLNGDMERVLLKRVLLAYARYNKTIGYCQGFNVIAALILEVMEYSEEPALKVMIMLIEHVLPSGYFDQTLRALSVDMAVLRDLVHQRLPKLSAHLDYLMLSSESEFEPPLTNVFSMQWFLTLFATCLPKQAVFRIWDSLMLEGSEILLRAALAIWAKIGRRIYKAKSADSYYTMMGMICQELLHMNNEQCNDLMQVIYSMAEFPYPGLSELRDKYTWNIQPFSSAFRLLRQQVVSILKSDDESGSELGPVPLKSEPTGAGGFLTPQPQGTSRNSSPSASTGSANDLSKLEKQYKLIRQRQKQAAIILQNALANSSNKHSPSGRVACVPPSKGAVSRSNGGSGSGSGSGSGGSDIFNHLYLTSEMKQPVTTSTLNGTFAVAPRVVQPAGQTKSRPSKPSPAKPTLHRMKSDDSAISADTGGDTIVPPTALTSPPLTPASVVSGSLSTPTSSGGGSSPTSWTPVSSPIFLSSPSQLGSGATNRKMRRHSIGYDTEHGNSQPNWRIRRRWHSCDIFPGLASSTFAISVGPSEKQSRTLSVSSAAVPKRRYKKPPPLDLRKMSNGNMAKPSAPPERVRSISSSSSARLLTTATNGATSTLSQAHATMLKKSKAILASISSTEEDEGRSSNAMRNPFPVKRQTRLIERGKRLGLYS